MYIQKSKLKFCVNKVLRNEDFMVSYDRDTTVIISFIQYSNTGTQTGSKKFLTLIINENKLKKKCI